MTSPTISKIFYAMHWLCRLKEYKPGTLVLGTKEQKAAEQSLYDWGERLEALIDWWLVDVLDYELVDIFNWQEEAAGMISRWSSSAVWTCRRTPSSGMSGAACWCPIWWYP